MLAIDRAISIHQPWAWLIARGYKVVENRSWKTNFRGPLLIQASSSEREITEENEQILLESHPHIVNDLDSDLRLFFGAAIGVVDIVGCISLGESDDFDEACKAQGYGDWLARVTKLLPLPAGFFADGPFCFLLENPRMFAKPFWMSGKLNIFTLNDVEKAQTTDALRSLGCPAAPTELYRQPKS